MRIAEHKEHLTMQINEIARVNEMVESIHIRIHAVMLRHTKILYDNALPIAVKLHVADLMYNPELRRLDRLKDSTFASMSNQSSYAPWLMCAGYYVAAAAAYMYALEAAASRCGI